MRGSLARFERPGRLPGSWRVQEATRRLLELHPNGLDTVRGGGEKSLAGGEKSLTGGEKSLVGGEKSSPGSCFLPGWTVPDPFYGYKEAKP